MNKQKKRKALFPKRVYLIGFFIALQIVLVVWLLLLLSSRVIFVYAAFQFVSIIMVLYMVNRKGDPSYKITWIIFILLIPPIGGILYLLWGGSRVLPNRKRKLTLAKSANEPFLLQDIDTQDALRYYDRAYVRQSLYLQRESGCPLYRNTQVEYFSPGEAFLPHLLEGLRRARRYIFIEFFILAEGSMWDQIHEILLQKVRQGVEVRIIFDDFGSIARQSKGFVAKLRQEGLSVSVFNPLKPSVNIFMNNRNHRKIVVIDGETAFTGGLNIADEYVNLTHPHGYWMDCAARFDGEAVRSFVVMFLTMWQFTAQENSDVSHYLSDYSCPQARGFVQPYYDDPLNDRNPAQGLYMQILSAAQDYVYIVTPYLILDNTTMNVLTTCAKSGVDVRIITPSKWDKWYVHPVTQYHYDELLAAGVRIYEYAPGFIHSKLFVCDDRVATVGTVNMDYRSFFFHFECGAWLCGCEAVSEIRDDVQRLLLQSRQILPEEWAGRPKRQRAKQALLHLIAPFL